MNAQQLMTFAKLLGLKSVSDKKRTGYVVAKCPFAVFKHKKGTDSDPSYGFKIGARHGTCLACGTGGDLDTILTKLTLAVGKSSPAAIAKIVAARTWLESNAKPVLSIGKADEDTSDTLIDFPETYLHNKHPAYDHPYFATRKGGPIPYAVAEAMDFRLDWKKNRIGVPIRDFDGILMGFHARTVNDHPLPYLAYTHQDHWNRPVWSGEHRLDLNKPVIMVESIFDEARVMQVYRNVCSPLSASLNENKIKRMGSALRIIEMFDQDEAGQIAAKKLRSFLPDSIIQSPGLPAPYKDPGETPAPILHQFLSESMAMDPIWL